MICYAIAWQGSWSELLEAAIMTVLAKGINIGCATAIDAFSSESRHPQHGTWVHRNEYSQLFAHRGFKRSTTVRLVSLTVVSWKL